MQDTRYPVSATVQRVVDGQVSRVEQVFDTVAAAFKELWRIPQAVLALRVELSGSNIPAEDLACLFQLEMYNMTELYLGAEPSMDDPPTYLFPYTTEQWPVEYPPVRSINPEDYIRYYPQVLPPFTYAHFLYGLQLWVALERVEIRHFLHVPTADKDHIPAGELDPCDWTFAMHRNLKTFIVEDIPCRVQFLLGYVYIPTHVDVHLTAMNITRSFEADMVKEMVPYLPAIVKGVRMLDEATHIHVKVGPRSLLLCGKLSSDEDDKRRLILEARPNSASVFEPDRARGGFLHSLLHLVRDIFDLSVVSSLRITGDVTWISSKDDWANLLRPFQNLRTLRVGYYAPWGISGRVSALCEGLAVTSYGACHGFGDPSAPA
ncbi:hypothetical protein C8T65DRAFT_742542 [Cerioporus squamosus]|nr:hypothetical protein C8T65DRAFT_742542 [Cerioporus squamosus]